MPVIKINSLEEFINLASGIVQTVGMSKYEPANRSDQEREILKNVTNNDAKNDLNDIFNQIYHMQIKGFRELETEEELNEYLQETWPSLKGQIIDWWKKYVDPNIKFDVKDQDPNLGSVETKSQFYARTGYTRDPEDMSESLLRRYIKNIITS